MFCTFVINLTVAQLVFDKIWPELIEGGAFILSGLNFEVAHTKEW